MSVLQDLLELGFSQGAGMTVLILGLMGVAASVFFGGAVLIVHWWRTRQNRHRRQQLDTWKPIFLEVMWGDRSAEQLLQNVQPADHQLFLEFLHGYAITLSGEALAQIRTLATPFLEPTRRSISARQLEVRARAVHWLGVLGDKADRDRVAERLDDPTNLVAMTAAMILARYGGRNHISQVLRAIDRFGNYGRHQLTSLLAEMGQEAIPGIREILFDSEHPVFSRVAAAEALRLLNDAWAADGAADLLTESLDRELSAALLRFLARVGTSQHAKKARELCRHEDPVIRMHAISALGALGAKDDRKCFARALRDSSRWVARRAGWAAAERGYETVLTQFSESNHQHSDLAHRILQTHGEKT